MYPDVYKAAILYNLKCTKWSKSKIVAGCQVSSLRFFMNCPCLYGLEASPENWSSSSEFQTEFNTEAHSLTDLTHLVCPDTGSAAEVCTEPAPVLCCLAGPLVACPRSSEGFYYASASDDSQACWAGFLWAKGQPQGHPDPQSHKEWNPRAQGHLRSKTNWKWDAGLLITQSKYVEPLQHLLNTHLCCWWTSWVQLQHLWR